MCKVFYEFLTVCLFFIPFSPLINLFKPLGMIMNEVLSESSRNTNGASIESRELSSSVLVHAVKSGNLSSDYVRGLY